MITALFLFLITFEVFEDNTVLIKPLAFLLRITLNLTKKLIYSFRVLSERANMKLKKERRN